MRYFRYGLFAMIKKPLFNILVMIELAGIFIVGNLTIAASNSRSVYYEPYAELMHREGYIFVPRKYSYDGELKLKSLYDSLENVQVVCHYDNVMYTDSFYSALDPSGYVSRDVVAFDDSIYQKFNLPLEQGRWASCRKNFAGQVEAVAVRNRDALELGDIIPFYTATADENHKIQYRKAFDVVVVGIISNQQYCPDFRMAINEQQSVSDLYHTETPSNGAAFYAAAGADELLRDPHVLGASAAFITFQDGCTEPQKKKVLESLGLFGGSIMAMSDFRDNSDQYLYEQYRKLMPILLGVFIIVLAELVCSVTMNTRGQLRNYGIYYLCGCGWRDTLKISMTNAGIMICFSVLLGGCGLLLMAWMPFTRLFLQNLAENNMIISLLVMSFTLVLSLIIPGILIGKTQPVDMIKER